MNIDYINFLPPNGNIETKPVLKKAAEAHRYLAELKGIANTIPNQNILIDTLSLQEAKESSAIENIVSTFDDIYQSNAVANNYISSSAKEVHAYSKALKVGFELIKKKMAYSQQVIFLKYRAILKIIMLVSGNYPGQFY